jgi:hypothetical protein
MGVSTTCSAASVLRSLFVPVPRPRDGNKGITRGTDYQGEQYTPPKFRHKLGFAAKKKWTINKQKIFLIIK